MNNNEYSWTKGDNHSEMQIHKQIKHSYPPLKLFHAEANMNHHEYTCIWNNTNGR